MASCGRSRLILLEERLLPELQGWDYAELGEETDEYNCIAWAAGDSGRWWWPSRWSYWPAGVASEETLDAFIAAFETLGYAPCADDSYEPAFERIALWVDPAGRPTHAARQVDDLCWTSKLGEWHLICHPLGALNPGYYGQVKAFLRRPRAADAPVIRCG